jgi:hypothetical protein
MISQPVLLAALAGTAAAVAVAPTPSHHIGLLPTPVVRREVEARQTDAACLAAISDVYEDMPTPPSQVVDFFMSQTVTDLSAFCEVTPPPSVESAMSSYVNDVSSWFNDVSDDFASALDKCPDLSSIYNSLTDQVGAIPTCGSGSGGSGGSGSGSGSGSGATGTGGSSGAQQTGGSNSGSGFNSAGSNSNGNNNNNNNNNNGDRRNAAAPRQVGLVGAGVALAGFLIGIIAL